MGQRLTRSRRHNTVPPSTSFSQYDDENFDFFHRSSRGSFNNTPSHFNTSENITDNTMSNRDDTVILTAVILQTAPPNADSNPQIQILFHSFDLDPNYIPSLLDIDHQFATDLQDRFNSKNSQSQLQSNDSNEIVLPTRKRDLLPTYTYNSHNEKNPNSSQCAVCMANFDDGDLVRTLPCIHRYHATCIDTWLEKATHCPLCKNDIEKALFEMRVKDL